MTPLRDIIFCKSPKALAHGCRLKWRFQGSGGLFEFHFGNKVLHDGGIITCFGAHKALNTPRYASLPGIMKAKKKPFDKKSPSELGADAGDAKTLIKKFSYPPEKPPGKLFQGEDVAVMVDKVVKALREEAQVI